MGAQPDDTKTAPPPGPTFSDARPGTTVRLAWLRRRRRASRISEEFGDLILLYESNEMIWDYYLGDIQSKAVPRGGYRCALAAWTWSLKAPAEGIMVYVGWTHESDTDPLPGFSPGPSTCIRRWKAFAVLTSLGNTAIDWVSAARGIDHSIAVD